MPREYGVPVPERELGFAVEQFDSQAAKKDEMSAERLRSMGIYPHFEGVEIETKLNRNGEVQTPERTLQILQKALEKKEYRFVGALDTRENYIIYYAERNHNNHSGHRGKIVVRNRGRSGFQVKLKAQRQAGSFKHILIKPESKGEVYGSLTEAENYLAEKLRLDHPQDHVESVGKRKACKLTMAAQGPDSVTRYFRLVADETAQLRAAPDAKKFRQIELEYKGSNSTEPDDMQMIQEQMEGIVLDIQAVPGINTERTSDSKRGWLKAQKHG